MPVLRTYPFVRIWHAGCSTGEEVYSLAILLQEEGCYDRCRIYATDINEAVLRAGRGRASFPLRRMQREHRELHRSRAAARVLARTTRRATTARCFDPSLRRTSSFAQHNLVTDGSFNEFHLILCRNVIIYFNRPLQERVHRLLYESLVRFGFLGLGSKETVRFTPHERSTRSSCRAPLPQGGVTWPARRLR